MVQQWYYGRGTDISGPVSSKVLTEMASSGAILQSDTIYEEGVESGVQANLVKNLFSPAALASMPPLATAFVDVVLAPVAEPGSNGVAEILEVKPEVEIVSAAPNPEYLKPDLKKKARAVAGKGVILMGQDGMTVRFKVKCSVCGKEDSSWKSMAIPRGTARVSFYCAKCRKKRDGSIDGFH